jgi:hypothetical protein
MNELSKAPQITALRFFMHVYEVRPRKDKRGVDLISDVLPFGLCGTMEVNAISQEEIGGSWLTLLLKATLLAAARSSVSFEAVDQLLSLRRA